MYETFFKKSTFKLIKNFGEFKLYEIEIDHFEKVLFFESFWLGVRGIIAIHNTFRGPALGGCRIHSYDSFEEGLHDALQLAKAMTYKNAIVDLPYGGGKCVIFKTLPLSKVNIFRVLHQVINYLDGSYLTADDIGTSVQDMEFLRKSTPFARGIQIGERQIPATSFGVYQALKAAYFHKTGKHSLEGVRVVVQGLGKTGYPLCEYLHNEKCLLYVDDLNPERIQKAVAHYGASPININHDVPFATDIFCPCALGGSINHALLSNFSIQYIAGSANNQLNTVEISDLLVEKKITYIPDYLSNAGGVIDIFCEGDHYSEEYVFAEVARIYKKTLEVLREAEKSGSIPLLVANQIVEENLSLGENKLQGLLR